MKIYGEEFGNLEEAKRYIGKPALISMNIGEIKRKAGFAEMILDVKNNGFLVSGNFCEGIFNYMIPIETPEKIYTASCKEEARHLVNEDVLFYHFEDKEWRKGRYTGLKYYGYPYFTINLDFDVYQGNLYHAMEIKELPPIRKVTLKEVCEKFGEEVEIV